MIGSCRLFCSMHGNSADAQALSDAQNGCFLDAAQPANAFDTGAVTPCNRAQVVTAADSVIFCCCQGFLFLVVFECRVFGNQVLVIPDVAGREIDNQFRIDGVAQIARLKMQVRAGGAAGVASQADRFAAIDAHVFVHQDLGQVCIDGLQSVVVAYNHIVPVSACFVVNDAHLSSKGRTDSVADLYLHIRAVMETVAAWAEFGCDIALCRHAEFLAIDIYGVGNAVYRRVVCVYAFASPDVFVQVIRWMVFHQVIGFIVE